MHIFNEIMKCKDKVKKLLEVYPECRDDDKRLLAYYQWITLKLEDKISMQDFFERTRFAELPAAESITRARRKVQELNPELMGARQKQRAAEAECVAANINN